MAEGFFVFVRGVWVGGFFDWKNFIFYYSYLGLFGIGKFVGEGYLVRG